MPDSNHELVPSFANHWDIGGSHRIITLRARNSWMLHCLIGVLLTVHHSILVINQLNAQNIVL